MTSAVQHRKGTTAEHATFTGLEGEVTIDTTKDTAVIHDGSTVGGFPLAKENLANFSTSGLSTIDGASTASDDKFLIYDQSTTSLKTITRAELNNAMEQDALANVAITGGTIDGTTIGGTTPAAITGTTITANTSFSGALNGTVGATTPASGAFTTLTTSSTVTHNGGTANGVAYLNGSKALTTGSALTFDGTNLGIGTSSPTQALTIYRGSGLTGGIEVAGNGNTLGSTSFFVGQSSSGDGFVYQRANAPLYFGTNNTTKATLDAAGNFGLGVTPSVQDATYRAINLSANPSNKYWSLAAHSSSACEGNLLWNAYSTGNETFAYTATGDLASRFRQSGYFAWYTAPSGTAGNPISFTQAMTLEATGNLLLGGTDTSIRSGIFGIGIGNASLTSAGTALKTDGRNWLTFTSSSATYGNGYIFYDATAGAERARITSAGELLVGTTTPGIGKMTVNGGITTTGYPQFNVYSTNSSTAFEWVLRSGTEQQFYVNNASVMARLTSSGVWTNASDARYKENIRPATYGLAELMQLHPRAYNVIGSTRQEIGFVAQEVEPLIPELVESTRNSVTEQDRLTLSYGQLSAVIVKAIQEQQAIIEQLKADVAALKGN